MGMLDGDGDRRGRDSFGAGGEFGASHCNQYVETATRSFEITLGRSGRLAVVARPIHTRTIRRSPS